MQTGTVVRLDKDKGFGFIQPDGGGRQVYFRRSACQGPFDTLEAASVEFEAEDGDRGPRAIRVLRVGSASPGGATARESQLRGPLAGERFLNPYNFVRPVAEAGGGTVRGVGAQLMGRCPPPPRDRYVGLTGRVVCRVTTRTPTFVSDSYAVSGAQGEHRSYRFFRDPDGVPCVPGTTLRGVVRSVFEAATNSCWELVSPRTLSRRVQTEVAAGLVPGRLVRKEDTWSLHVFDGNTETSSRGPVAEGEPLHAAWVARYDRGGKSVSPRPSGAAPLPPGEAQAYGERGFPTIPGGLEHGTGWWARMRRTNHPARRGGREFDFWNVEAFAAEWAVLEADAHPEDRIVYGYYCENGYNIQTKHDERFFFTTQDPEPEPLEVDRKHVRDYLRLLKDYRELHRQEVGTTRKDRTHPSRFIALDKPGREDECDGELVYAWLEPDGRTIRALAPVSVPRLFYDGSIGDRFPAHIAAVMPCSRFNRARPHEPCLCPSCRVFGWVFNPRGDKAPEQAGHEPEQSGEAPKRKQPRSGASRSRVRFGSARFTGRGAIDETPRALDILSSPKPTTVRFYLSDGKLEPVRPGERVVNTGVDYDRGHMVARGRKFYRAHRSVDLQPPPESPQNRTLRDWLNAGQSATFEIDFECLAPVELGALLWALELQPEWTHRLGYGKPLGLGSVSIAVEGLTLVRKDRYAEVPDLAEPGDAELGTRVEELKVGFRRAMEQAYGAAFERLPNIADLGALLGPADPHLPVTYPTMNDPAVPESFRWFVVNNGRPNPRNRNGRGVWLPLAANDRGLPFDPALP